MSEPKISLKERKKQILNFVGPVAAVPTPNNCYSSSLTETIHGYAEYLNSIGVKGVFILGTVGESFALSLKEKCLIIEAWANALKSINLLAIVNISSMSIADIDETRRLVEQKNCFTGIGLLQPLYYRTMDEHQMLAYCKHIIDQSNGTLPLLYYHFPEQTGPANFKLESFVNIAIKQLPQFCAIKYTDTNIVRLGTIQNNFRNQIKIFAGYDEILLAAKAALSIDAGICATFNFGHSVNNYNEMVRMVDAGNLAQAQKNQQNITEFCARLRSSGNLIHSIKVELDKELAANRIQFGKPRLPVYFDSKEN